MALLKRSNQVQNGPIPGENYTSDTKNYPWHRPPKYTNLDDAIEHSYKKLMEKPNGLLTMIKAGIPIPGLVELFLLNGMSKGNWTPDFMILMAGPIAHIMYLMAKEAKITPNMDLEEKGPHIGPSWVDMMDEIQKKSSGVKKLDVDIEKVKEAAGGFMSVGEDIADDMDTDTIDDVETPDELDAESAFEDDEVGVI